MKSLRIAELLQSPATDAEVVVKGWVRTKRGNKNVAFIALNDGSCVANMQVVVDLAKFDEELLRKVTTGACLRVDGRLVASCGAGQGVEVQAEKIEIYGTADPETFAEEGTFARIPARHRLSASPYQHVRCDFPHPSRDGLCDT